MENRDAFINGYALLKDVLGQLCLTADDITEVIEQDKMRLKGKDGKVLMIDEEAINVTQYPATLQVWLDEGKICYNETAPSVSVALSMTPAWAPVLFGIVLISSFNRQ